MSRVLYSAAKERFWKLKSYLGCQLSQTNMYSSLICYVFLLNSIIRIDKVYIINPTLLFMWHCSIATCYLITGYGDIFKLTPVLF